MRGARIPNRLQWGLRDILCATTEARRAYDTLREAVAPTENINHQYNNGTPAQARERLLAALLTLSDSLAEIERKARNASQGIYEE